MGSFKHAAEELHVSPSTISHQVRDLEQLLGYPLFSRGGLPITLTEEGQQFVVPLNAAFELLREVGRPKPVATQFRIGAFPFLANEILMPRLGELRDLLDVPVTLHTRTELEALTAVDSRERLDVVVRYNREKGFPGYQSRRLFDVNMVPMLSPDAEVPEKPEQLLDEPLIRVIGPFEGWQHWIQQYAPDRASAPLAFSVETDSFHAAALATARGDGVCLAIMPFLRPWLAEQRIQALEQFAVEIDQSACLVYGHHHHQHPVIDRFADWLQDACTT